MLSIIIPLNTLSCKNSCTNESINILIVGNSFGDDTVEYMPEIAKSAGYTNFKIANLYVPGCSLEQHYNNINNNAEYSFRYNEGNGWDYEYGGRKQTVEFGVKFAKWDVIVFQQASPKSGVESSYLYLKDVITKVLDYIDYDVKCAFNMTWAYQHDSTHSGFVTYNYNQITMYNAIVSSVKNQVETESLIDFIIPNGTAIQNARTSSVGDCLTRDGFHLSYDLGRYIAGLTAFSKITGISVEKIKYSPKSLDEPLTKIAKQSVKNALNNPYIITKF